MVSFKTFKTPKLPKTSNWSWTIFAFSYSNTALVLQRSLKNLSMSLIIPWYSFQYSTDVLNTFKSYKVDAISGSRQRKTDDENEQFFAKYLTNQNLLQLQLSDSNFRRYILIQFLILFQYLKSAVKFKR